ncbi:hypothetical protein UVI_02031230 [Ustilaginoidea virens]|nr:hypothetical protein UVI_02031230 [Ustilaginoidea virens]
MVSEDAWYGVARSLAQDISSLHGSFLLANAFQAQTEPYAPNMMPPRSSSPEKSSESGSSSSDSEDEVVPYETSRITEVLEDENSVITSRRPATDAAETDTEGHSSAAETPGFEMQNGGPDDDSDDEDEDGVTMDDDAGFPTMESPVRVGQVVQPTPSPPSPPTSAHRSSSLVKYARPQRTPSPVRSIGRKTPLRLQTLKPRTPTSQQSDPFDLPSSPQPAGTFSQGSAGTFQNDGAEPEAPHDDSQKFLGSFQEVVDVESQVADEAKPCWIDDASRTDDMSAGLHRGSSALAGRQRESSEAAASPVSQARNKGSPNRAARAAASTGNVVATPTKPVTDVSPKAPPTSLTRLGPGQSKMTDFSTLADATPRKSPRAVRVSPKRTLLDTSATAVTPEKPAARRSAMVPRSTERCTPVFVESTAAPLKLPMLENRRTMKQLKQAVIAPRLKAVDPNPPASKGPPTNPGENPVRDMPGFPAEPKKALNSQAWKAASTKHTPEPKNTDSRAASSEPRLASRTKGSEPKASTRSISPTTSPPRHQPPDVVRRSAPRQPLPPRASVDSKSRAEQDQGDELGNLAKPKKASSSKPPRPFISSKIARDSSRKTRKPSPPTTEEHRPARERDGKGKKRRRADVPGTPAASGGSAAKVCGVDGYTCNRDFCFTCL